MVVFREAEILYLLVGQNSLVPVVFEVKQFFGSTQQPDVVLICAVNLDDRT